MSVVTDGHVCAVQRIYEDRSMFLEPSAFLVIAGELPPEDTALLATSADLPCGCSIYVRRRRA